MTVSFVVYDELGTIQMHGTCPVESFTAMQPKNGWSKMQIKHEQRVQIYEKKVKNINEFSTS